MSALSGAPRYWMLGVVLSALGVPAVLAGASPAEQRKVAFVSDRDGNEEIYLMNIDGTEQVNLTANPAVDRYPAWSPDGQRIAFVSDRDGNKEIYVMGRDGAEVVRLTEELSVDTQPAWSPDGERLVFASDREGTMDLFMMGADGTGVTRLTRAGSDEFPTDWSQDGTRILFHAPVPDFEQFVLVVDDRTFAPLTDNESFDGAGTWLSSRRVVFVTKRDGNDEIYVMNGGGGRLVRLTDSPAIDRYPDGSGQEIVFDSKRDGNFEIYVMLTDGSAQTRITKNPATDWFARSEP